MSLRDADGNNAFALSGEELKTGRSGAANDDTKFMSQEGEWFLAGVLDGIADGKALPHPVNLDLTNKNLLVMPMVSSEEDILDDCLISLTACADDQWV